MKDIQDEETGVAATETPLLLRIRDRLALFLNRRRVRRAIECSLGIFLVAVLVLGAFYIHFAHVINVRLVSGAFADTTNIYTAPRMVAIGDPVTLDETVARLRRDGYTTSRTNAVGWYSLQTHRVEIYPGPDSSAGSGPCALEFAGNKIARIVDLRSRAEQHQCQLEPQLIANLSGRREKRRMVRFRDLPPGLVHAVISAEDKHFFHHTGFDLSRILKAAYVDLRDGRKAQGASTLSMQLARSLCLTPDKHWSRKFEELLITAHLEDKLTKQQIFEDYANQVYLGRRGTFSINGFGEGARAFFGKDIAQLNDAELATMAGMVQRPSYFNPDRWPDRTRERRDTVLGLMRQNGYLTDAAYRQALQTPLRVTPQKPETIDSQYFVDLMNDELQNDLGEHSPRARYVYTTLDPDLQLAAEDAVHSGMQNVDQQLHRKKRANPSGEPQVALIALDPHTGEIKALVGGRDYGASQLNHVSAMRQPGSAFKPFVYAAALETALAGGSDVITPATQVDGSPTTFTFQGHLYEPGNYGHDVDGPVTLRTALAQSLNVAAVSLAERVGYAKVVNLARRAGLNDSIQGTPAVALGAYETTPLEIAKAYTIFANHGVRVTPTTLSLARAGDGSVLHQHVADAHAELDPRVAYLMVDMMQEVLRSGTGAAVRSRGFNLPAAGKTGTSRDGWFAGFTNDLLCIVWVGFDDNRDLNLEGAHSALPIWTEFMKRAAKSPQYRNSRPFQPPSGVESVNICQDSGQVAGPYCPETRSAAFLAGSAPDVTCSMHSPGTVNYADRTVEVPPKAAPAPPAVIKQQ